MSTPIGINGGILVGAESTYGTEASSKAAIHAISASLGQRRGTRKSTAWLSPYAQRLEQGVTFVDGEIVAAFTREEDVIGDILGLLGAVTTGTCTIGAGNAPDVDSLTVAVNHGAAPEYTYTGLVPSSVRIDLPSNGQATITCGFAGKAAAKEATPTSITDPSESLILMPSSYGTLSIDGTDYDFNNFSLEFAIPTAYAGADAVGGSTVRRAFWSGPMVISGSIDLDFDDDSGSNVDTVSLLDDVYYADGDLTTISLTDGTAWVTLGSCEMLGDPPSLTNESQSFSLNFEAQTVAIDMS